MENISDKSKTTTAVLSFFIGGFGAHRFYANRTGSAVVMLLLTLSVIGALISGIWNLIDFIKILTGSFKDSKGNLIKND